MDNHLHHSPQHAFVTGAVLTSSSAVAAGRGATVHRYHYHHHHHHRSPTTTTACSIRTSVVCANVNGRGGNGSARSSFHGVQSSSNSLRLMSAKCHPLISTSTKTNNTSYSIIPNSFNVYDDDDDGDDEECNNNTSTAAAAAAAATATTINDGMKIPSSIKQPQHDDDVLIPQPRDDEDSEANVDAAINDLTPITDSNNKNNVDFQDATSTSQKQVQPQQQQQPELKPPPPRPRSYKQFKESFESEADEESDEDDVSDQQQHKSNAVPSQYTKETGDDNGRQTSSRSMPPRSYQQHQQQQHQQRFNQRGGAGDSNNNNNRAVAPMEIDATATYYTRCGKCQAVYELKPEALGPRGRKVSCSVCNNVWFQRPDRLSKLDASKEEMIDYPMDRKENLMAEALSARNHRRGGGGSSFNNNNNKPGGMSVFLANLSYDMTVDELTAEIGKSGLTVGQFRVSIVKDQATGKSKGYAFCDVSTERDMQLVMQHMQGLTLKGRPVSVRIGKKNYSSPSNNNNNYNNNHHSNYNNNNRSNNGSSYNNGNGYQNRQQQQRRPPPGGDGGQGQQPPQQ